MLCLAVLCLLFGVFPTVTISVLNGIAQELLGITLPHHLINNWLWLVPVTHNFTSYGAPIIFVGIVAAWLIIYLLLHVRRNEVVKKIPWDCGFGSLNSKMQYTATAFAMPIRRIFKPLLQVHEMIVDNKYYLHVGDKIWGALYLPIAVFIDRLALVVARIQGGNIRVYLSYVFTTLLILLWIVVI